MYNCFGYLNGYNIKKKEKINMVKLRDLAEANKKDGDMLLSNTPTPMTAEIKEKVFKGKLSKVADIE
jgi:hypothetical protein